MKTLHIMQCPLDGYEPLELCFDLGITQTQLNAAREAGNPCPALVGLPNWETAAAALDLPGAAPSIPLTESALMDLPFVLVSYIASDEAVADALRDYMETRHSKSRRR